jgi:hypothetical protein
MNKHKNLQCKDMNKHKNLQCKDMNKHKNLQCKDMDKHKNLQCKYSFLSNRHRIYNVNVPFLATDIESTM